jgi:phosphoribosyl 1,2-cyclic phosphate phosphodiesterase
MEIIFLGSSDEEGVPRIGCDCEVCRGALETDSRNYRTGPSIAVRFGPTYSRRQVLIDVAPEFRLQATQQGLGPFDGLLLTHAHDAHILGLSALVKAQRKAGHPLAIHAPAEVLDNVRDRFGYLWTDKLYRRVMQPKAINKKTNLWGLEAQPFRVDHGIGGTAYGYLLVLDELRLAYVPDMLQANSEARQILSGLDLLVLGASHYYEGIEIWKRSVMDIMAALELIREVEPRQAVLTHLSHTVAHDEISSKLPPNVRLAYDGLTVEVET